MSAVGSGETGCHCCRSWQPLGVALVTSGSRGNRLLCYRRGYEPRGRGQEVKDVLSELPPRTLAEILASCSLMVGHRFELSVDEWHFVGFPFAVATGAFATTFDVVFVLQAHTSPEVVGVYDKLSHVIGSAIVHEQHRCGFFASQAALLMEEGESHEPFSEHIVRVSSLAHSLEAVLRSLLAGECHVRVKINQCSEVSMQVPFHHAASDQTSVTSHRRVTSVRSYAALLLLEGADSVAGSLPPSCSPALHRLLGTVSPMKSLQAVSLDAGIPLAQVLHLAAHLVAWGKAVSIYPLSEHNTYTTSPQADISTSSSLSSSFSNTFPGLSLVEILAQFSLPLSLSELKQMYPDEPIVPVVAWLLRHRQIMQLHTYVYIAPVMASPPPSPLPSSPPSSGFGSAGVEEGVRVGGGGGLVGGSPDSGHSDEGVRGEGVERLLRQQLTEEECRAVLDSTAASDPDDLETFARLCGYFRGTHHLEEMMLRENMSRSELRTLVDKFSEVLVTCILPEQPS